MNENSAQRIFFGVLLIAVTAAFIWLIRGFVQPIFWAVALGIVFFPLHQMLEKRLNGRRSLAATLSTIAILLIVVLPIAAIAAAVAGEAANLYQRIQNNDINVSGAVDWAQQQLPLVVEGAERLGVDLDGLRSQLSSSAVT